ncbi:MAG: hypothetical protein N4A33_04435 [Bacteriovoracaceae bacterium]|jgi:hypothetical protein|nr:hypothetical protein [Bacteriovoracaceae bacterium]
MLKKTNVLFILILLVGCHFEARFKEKSSIDALAPSKTFAQKNNGSEYITKTAYLPLTQDIVEYYDYDKLISELKENAGSITKLFSSLGNGLLNVGIKLSNKKHHKLSMALPFDYVDTDYIKSVKIKNLFFQLEGCGKELEDCDQSDDKKKVNFRFLEELFINLSPDYTESEKLYDVDYVTLDTRGFKHSSKMAFRPMFSDYVTKKSKKYDTFLKNFTVARYNKIKDQKPTDNIFMLKVEPELLTDLKDLIIEEYGHLILHINPLGDNLYIKFKDKNDIAWFQRDIIKSRRSLYKVAIKESFRCSAANCINFEVNPINLLPWLNKSKIIKLDTYMKINELIGTDFEYRGLVELEVKIKL